VGLYQVRVRLQQATCGINPAGCLLHSGVEFTLIKTSKRLNPFDSGLYLRVVFDLIKTAAWPPFLLM
jgi:hypothetical protein